MRIASRGARTYLHGDLRIANTYIRRAGGMGIGDWQIGLQGCWVYEYAYLVASALEVEDRRVWERDLLNFYLDRLGAAGGEAIPREMAWLAYRQAFFYPSFAWVYTIGRSRLQPSSRLQPKFQPDDVSLAMIERMSAAIDDLNSFAAIGL